MNAGVMAAPDVVAAAQTVEARPEAWNLRRSSGWNPEAFAQEQILGLVRRVFFSGAERLVRQVIFSAVETETDVRSLSCRVAEVLASETAGSVAVAKGADGMLREAMGSRESREGKERLRQIATQMRRNLWLLPARGEEPVTAASLNQYLSEIRREFEYSVVAARSLGESTEAMAMSQFADGIILVLSARHTRRAAARWIKEGLEGSRARVLGAVLSDRVFPIPEAVYRRL
jgi:hypothetical protein